MHFHWSWTCKSRTINHSPLKIPINGPECWGSHMVCLCNIWSWASPWNQCENLSVSESGPLLLPHCQQRKEGKRNVCFRIAVLGDQQKTNNLLLLQDSRKKKRKRKNRIQLYQGNGPKSNPGTIWESSKPEKGICPTPLVQDTLVECSLVDNQWAGPMQWLNWVIFHLQMPAFYMGTSGSWLRVSPVLAIVAI